MKAKDWDKLANNYFDEVSSPFCEVNDDKLFRFFKNLKDSKKKTVIDLGCGPGNFVPFLSSNFKRVTAIDFSKEMVNVARKKSIGFKNVDIFVSDLRNLKKYYGRFDVAVSVNSVLLPSIREVDTIFSEIHKVIKEGAVFVGVFPSIDSDLYRAMLTYERELLESESERVAKKNTHIIIGDKTYDFLLGMFNNKGKQKHYYEFELVYRLKKAGFKDVHIQKLYYPWECCADKDISYFKDKPKLWDFFVTAKR